jgi:hypothetical protein
MADWIVVDVEADGPIPSKYSMVCFGAVAVTDGLDKTFYGETCPMSRKYLADALAVSGFSREEHEKFEQPHITMLKFQQWLFQFKKPVFVSDNPAFDWQWINYYFHHFRNQNPFGFSARRIGDLYCGMVKDSSKNSEWKKHLRKTPHDHNPVNDAKGNAEALLQMRKLGLRF